MIQIFNTVLLTPDNKTVIMPNGAVMNNHITNFTADGKIRVGLSGGISYSANIKQAKDVLEAALAADPRVLKSPAPEVSVAELGDSSVNLAVRPWCDPAVYWDVYFDTLESCKIALDKDNISIPFPQRDVHIYNHK
jgi:small conductance mechanosensitive channel